MNESRLKWGILGPGRIARSFAIGLATSATGQLVAAGSRDLERSRTFLQTHADATHGSEPSAYGSYEELIADPQVEALYIATPHPMHARWAIAAARAGKHLLIEKPMTVNRYQAMAVFEAARANDVFAMEAYMYRCHPQTARLVELVSSGEIGEVIAIQSSFSYRAAPTPESRSYARDLAGGGILDVGGYPVSMARLLAGAALGVSGMARPFVEPTGVKAVGTLGDTGIDEWTVATLTFESGISAQVTTGVALSDVNTTTVFGSKGKIHVPNPWMPGREGRMQGSIEVHRVGRDVEVLDTTGPELYAAEADHVAAHITDRQAPAKSWADSMGTLTVLDEWRSQLGLVFDDERSDSDHAPVSGQRIEVRDVEPMTYAEIPGTGKQASRIVMGVDNQFTLAHASVLFDDWVERGGRTFDTGYVYGRGVCEQMLGQWMKKRGVRDELVVIGKGAHTPHCTPEAIGRQLAESLDRLQTDHVDVYLMHRDDPSVPVGEFVDALDAELRAGRVRAYGGSNWSIGRFSAANAHAEANGRAPMTVLSNNLSLAEAEDVPWVGCQSLNHSDELEWLAETGTILAPWSSQARGFFTGRARPDDTSDEELVRCWYSDANFERLRRAERLASELGVSTPAIALAWVLHQPFPTFPLIGPRQISETVSSLQGLTVALSPEQVAWLDLKRESAES